LYWRTLSELNDDLEEFPWQSNEERQQYFADKLPFCPPVMYTGPPPEPPSVPQPNEPSAPQISSLATLIISSADKLFFMSHAISNDHREWHLVQVAFKDLVALYPSCLQDGQFLFDFYMVPPSDIRYNAINQRFWLQYRASSPAVFGTMDAHLIAPSDTSEDCAARHQLVPNRTWVNLTHSDTYLHGPFNFEVVKGHNTRDRVT
jgi:hypothetical protein